MYEIKAIYNFNNIPQELKNLRQWIVWKSEKVGDKWTKVPYNANLGYKCDVTDSNNLFSFSVVKSTFDEGYSGIGFVFTANDPYVGIDVDKIDTEPSELKDIVLETFNSYAEYSPSMSGCHIIIKGYVPKAIKYNGIEIYHCGRYFTFTGNLPEGCEDRGIIDCNEQIQALFEHLEREGRPQVNENKVEQISVETKCDNLSFIELIKLCKNGIYKEKYLLESGDNWQQCLIRNGGIFPSRSEVVQSLLNIITYYTRDPAKAKAVFKQTKIAKSYDEWEVDHKFNYAFKTALLNYKGSYEEELEQAERVDAVCANFAHALAAREKVAECPQIEKASEVAKSVFSRPPGLLGEIMDQVYGLSPRPIPEISLAASIYLMSSLCGAAYNVSNAGLNLYINMLAGSGTGKEAISSTTNAICKSVEQHCADIFDFFGPAEFASVQAFNKAFNKSQSIGIIIGEFGMKLIELKDKKAPNGIALRRGYTDIYGKSGKHNVHRGVSHSQSDQSTKIVNSPALTIIAEGAQTHFLKNLDAQMVEDGFIARFITIEYTGSIIKGTGAHYNHVISEAFKTKFANLYAKCHGKKDISNITDVKLDSEAFKLDDQFYDHCISEANATTSEINKAMWNRARLNSLKLAGLVAVGEDIFEPTINCDALMWAQNIIVYSVEKIIEMFEDHRIGEAASNEESVLTKEHRIISNAIVRILDGKHDRTINVKKCREKKLITLGLITNVCDNLGLSKRSEGPQIDRIIKTALDNMQSEGLLEEVTNPRERLEGLMKVTHKTKVYCILEVEILRKQAGKFS